MNAIFGSATPSVLQSQHIELVRRIMRDYFCFFHYIEYSILLRSSRGFRCWCCFSGRCCWCCWWSVSLGRLCYSEHGNFQTVYHREMILTALLLLLLPLILLRIRRLMLLLSRFFKPFFFAFLTFFFSPFTFFLPFFFFFGFFRGLILKYHTQNMPITRSNPMIQPIMMPTSGLVEEAPRGMRICLFSLADTVGIEDGCDDGGELRSSRM